MALSSEKRLDPSDTVAYEKSEVLSDTESSQNPSTSVLPLADESEKPQVLNDGKETPSQDGERTSKGENAVTEKEVSKNEVTSSDNSAQVEQKEKIYPKGIPFIVLTLALMASAFVSGLDQNILSTAIPKITTTFNSLNDVAMYQAAYGIGQMVIQPTMGKIYTYFNVKWLFIFSFIIFEVGSVLCAAAPSSAVLISGRAVAGFGGAGLYSGTWLIIVETVPLRARPLYISVVSSMFAVSGVAGPLLGGVFTDSKRLTWRFAFWINLPFGALVCAAVFFVFHPDKPDYANMSFKEKFKRLDLLGAAFLIPAVALLQVALQRGGTLYPWSNPNVWACLLVSGILLVVFVSLQIWKGDRATIPPRILKNRNIYSVYIFAATWGIAVPVHLIYLPFYFQSVQNTTAAQSGIRILPYCVCTTFGVIISGVLITLSGHYVPFMFLGSIILSVGSGLLFTLKVSSGISEWFGYQVMAALGFGLAAQVPFIVVQSVLAPEDVSTGTALIVFFQNFVGAIGIAIAQNLFVRTLNSKLSAIPGVNVEVLVKGSATEIRKNVPPALLARVLEAYNFSLMRAMMLAIVAGGLAFLVSFGMEWRKVEKEKKVDEPVPASAA